MLRILFCFTCCGTPPSSRPVRGKASVEKKSEELIEEADFKSVITLGKSEKERLLTNQIQANNEGYGSKVADQQGGIIQTAAILSSADEPLKREQDSITASTSVLLQSSTGADREFDAYGERELNFYDDQSNSPPSSIDIEAFRENPSSRPPSRNEGSLERNLETSAERRPSIGTSEIGTSKNIPSTTKIGDYARIEYSPVEDLDSVTTFSRSRPVSEAGGDFRSSAPGSVKSRDNNSTKENPSRRSSQGVESTSISITSQLSNERLQQNLTNMLESANSPIPMFGTIGLPLGPPLESMATETAKTSPETTGAALTSASQDSLSGSSLASRPASRAATLGSSNNGAALIGDSIEDSVDLPEMRQSVVVDGNKNFVASSDGRVETPISITTNTSGGLTNPTPTPSELSGASSKKKRRLRAKSILKRLKPGGKKKKNEDDGSDKK